MGQFVYQDADGVRRTMHYDEGNLGSFTVNTEVDVTRLVENNAALEELHSRHSMNKLLARVPLTVYEQSIHENWDDEQWRRWLNDPDNRAFRVWKGNL